MPFPPESPTRHLALGTISFAVCFTAWGLISAFAPVFRAQYQLTSTEVALLVSVPVLLGALARLPMGMITDRFGGRAVFAALTAIVAAWAGSAPTSGAPGWLANGEWGDVNSAAGGRGRTPA